MNTLRAIKSVLISGVLAAACSIGGAGGLYERFTYEDPAPVTCAGGIQDQSWVTLSGCEAVIVEAEYRQMKSGTVLTVTVPIRAEGATETSELRLMTNDEAVIDAVASAKAQAEQLEKFKENPNAVRAQLPGLAKALAPLKLEPLQARVESRLGGVVTLRQTDAGEPGLLWPLFLLLMGGVWALVALGGLMSIVKPAAPAEPEAAS
jgi:hypothetical protein